MESHVVIDLASANLAHVNDASSGLIIPSLFQQFGHWTSTLPAEIAIVLDDPGPLNCIEVSWGSSRKLAPPPPHVILLVESTSEFAQARTVHEIINERDQAEWESSHRFPVDRRGITTTEFEMDGCTRLRRIILRIQASPTNDNSHLDSGSALSQGGENVMDQVSIRRIRLWTKVSSSMALDTKAIPLLTEPLVPAALLADIRSKNEASKYHTLQMQDTSVGICFRKLELQKKLSLAGHESLENYSLQRASPIAGIHSEVLYYALGFLSYAEIYALSSVSKSMNHFASSFWNGALEQEKQWMDFALDPCVQVSCTSRWSSHSSESPRNLVDGSMMTWWSSARSVAECEIQIDLRRYCPVSRIALLWGDDGGRIRPCSASYKVFLGNEKGNAKFANPSHPWVAVFNGTKVFENPAGGVGIEEQLGTTTTCTTFAEVPVRFVKICFQRLQVSWNNHALTAVQIFGSARKGDC
jgi:hypothetical protein